MSFSNAVTLNDDPQLVLKPFKIFCLCSGLVYFYLAKNKLLARLHIITTTTKFTFVLKINIDTNFLLIYI